MTAESTTRIQKTKCESTTKRHRDPAKNAADVQRCWCDAYHYACIECGVDCTIGKPKAPAHSGPDGVIRCYEHHYAHEQKTMRHAAHCVAVHEQLVEALRYLVDYGIPELHRSYALTHEPKPLAIRGPDLGSAAQEADDQFGQAMKRARAALEKAGTK